MLGNVWEWVSDWHSRYPGGAVTDPAGPRTGRGRVARGGRLERVQQGIFPGVVSPRVPTQTPRRRAWFPLGEDRVTLNCWSHKLSDRVDSPCGPTAPTPLKTRRSKDFQPKTHTEPASHARPVPTAHAPWTARVARATAITPKTTRLYQSACFEPCLEVIIFSSRFSS